MRRRGKTRILALLVGLVTVVLSLGLFAGCGDQPLAPVSPNDNPIVVTNTGHDKDGKPVVDRGVDQAGLLTDIASGTVVTVEKTTSKLVSVLGGTLETTLPSGATRFHVPVGGVDELVRIDMKVKQTKIDKKYCTMYEFGPKGLEFNRTSTLTLLLPYPEGTVVTLRWFNPGTGQWEVQDSKPVRFGRVQFGVWHFSKYGIS